MRSPGAEAGSKAKGGDWQRKMENKYYDMKRGTSEEMQKIEGEKSMQR